MADALGTGTDSGTESFVPLDELKTIYDKVPTQNAYLRDIARAIQAILERDNEEAVTISEIESALTLILDAIRLQQEENDKFNRLISKLVFELQDQGVKIEDEELNNQLNYIQ